ncbi:MAG: DNA-binding protein [Rubrivivax sp.]|nr:DNA-binding protein [Rubrivivax sp.]
MKQTKRLKTPAQARAEFVRRGQSIAAWSRQHGLTPSLVYEILSGQSHRRCLRGQSHRAAVLLGIKDGTLGETAGS